MHDELIKLFNLEKEKEKNCFSVEFDMSEEGKVFIDSVKFSLKKIKVDENYHHKEGM